MATYQELYTFTSQPDWPEFLGKVRVAAVIKAVAILDSASPSAAAVAWATDAIARQASAGDDVVWYVVGTNNAATIAAILAATDVAIQTNVNDAVDAIAI